MRIFGALLMVIGLLAGLAYIGLLFYTAWQLWGFLGLVVSPLVLMFMPLLGLLHGPATFIAYAIQFWGVPLAIWGMYSLGQTLNEKD